MLKSDLRQSGAPIRRHSREAGFCEGTFWRRVDPRDVGRFMLAAERFERSRRVKGARNGPIGPVGLEVLRELLRMVDYKSGRLDPCLATLQARLKRSKDAVVRALANLRDAGFVDWIRRWTPAESGPPVRQTSNAYRLILPPAALALLGITHTTPPPPDDDATRRADQAEAVADMVARMSVEERPAALLGNTPLAAALSSLAAKLKAGWSVSPPDSRNPGREPLLDD